MNLKRFDELARVAGLGRSLKNGTGMRSMRAARLHLVDGLSIDEARKVEGISRQAVHDVLRKLEFDLCKTCKQPLPHDRPSARVRR